MMSITEKTDLWDYLAATDKPILLYGMGNGADKILSVCAQKHIEISDFFASDGFVRGHSFHGKVVLSYSAAKEKYRDFIVLLSFATHLEDVMDAIARVAAEQELYAPDVPVFGSELFDLAYYRAHLSEIETAASLLCDEESRRVMECMIRYRLTGKIGYLEECVSSKQAALADILNVQNVRTYLDLGAYDGDTIRELALLAPSLEVAKAWEPDARTYRKLSAYAEAEQRFHVDPVPLGAWDKSETLYFDASGNRNANLSGASLSATGKKVTSVSVDAPDALHPDLPVDFIKYDVEGAERQALLGSRRLIAAHHPRLLVSLYHRSEDIFTLPILVNSLCPGCRMYMRKHPYIPGWDLNLYVLPPV